jgi:hypothetical protein
VPKFLDTLGNSDIAIAICDRCKFKRAHSVMRSDPNFPGLQVCDQGCADEKDPYRLPARQTERITIRFPRPDLDIAVQNNQLITGGYGAYIISTQSSGEDPQDNGNLDEIIQNP